MFGNQGSAPSAPDSVRNVTVRMNADINQYVQSLNTAQVATGKFSKALIDIDKTFTKIKNTVGKGLIGVGVGGELQLTGAIVEASRFEQAMAKVNSVIAGNTKTNIKALSQAALDLSRSFPVAATEVGALMASVAQLGERGTDNIKAFTKAAIQLGATTDISGDQAVTALSRMQNAFGVAPSNISKTGSTLVALAAQSNVAASSILGFAQSIQGVASVVGLTMQQTLGLSAAITASGADAGLAANAVSKVLLDMTNTVREGGPDLALYSKLVGTTAAQFREMVRSNPAATFIDVINAIKKTGTQALPILQQLGLGDLRTVKVLTNIAQASGSLSASLATANVAFAHGTALTSASNKVFDTLISRLKTLKNQVEALYIKIGTPFLKPLEQGLTAGIKLFQLFNAALEKVGTVFKAVDKAMSSVPGWGVIKEIATILTALVPTAIAATGAIILFAGSLITFALGLRALRTAGPLLQGLVEGLAGLQTGKLSRIFNFLPFVQSVDTAGAKTKILSGLMMTLGSTARSVVASAYNMSKAFFLGSGPLERMGIAMHNLLAPANRLVNTVSGGLFGKMGDPYRFYNITPNDGLLKRAAMRVSDALAAAMNAGAKLLSPILSGWQKLASAIKSTTLFSAATQEAQMFGAALSSSATKFRTAMATMAAPIGQVLTSVMANVMGGVNSVIGKVTSRAGTQAAGTAAAAAGGQAVEKLALTTGAAAAAPAAVEELAPEAATNPFTGALLGVAVVLGGTELVLKHFRDSAQKAADAIDNMGSVTKNLASSLGHVISDINVNNVSPGKNQPGAIPNASTTRGYNDKDLLGLLKYQETDLQKTQALEQQFVNVARQSGQPLSKADMNQMLVEGSKAGIGATGMNQLRSDISAGPQSLMSFTRQADMVRSAVRASFGNSAQSLTGFSSKGAIVSMKAITDALYADYTASNGGADSSYLNAMVAGIQQAYKESVSHTGYKGQQGSDFFHQFLIQLGKSAGSGNLSFRGGGRYITDYSGLKDWAKANKNAGGFQGTLARAIEAGGDMTKLYNQAEAQQNDYFSGINATAAQTTKDNKNPIFRALNNINGSDFLQSDQQTLGENVNRIVMNQLGANKGNYTATMQQLLTARNTFTKKTGTIQNPYIEGLDQQITALGQSADQLFMQTLTRQVGQLPATQAMQVLDANIKQAVTDYYKLLNTKDVPQGLVENSFQKIQSERDLILQKRDDEVSSLTQLVGLQRQQAQMDHDHALQLADNARNYGRQLQDMYREFNQQVQDMTLSVAQQNNPFERLSYQGPVAGATDMANNLQDQNTTMARTRSELEKLKHMGLTDKVIQGLGLNDPSKYLQVDEFYQNMLANPNTIDKINKEWAKRLNLSKGFVTDSSDTQFQRMQASFDRNLGRMAADNARAVKQMNYSFSQESTTLAQNINAITEDQFKFTNQMLNKALTSSNTAISNYAKHVKTDLKNLNHELSTIFQLPDPSKATAGAGVNFNMIIIGAGAGNDYTGKNGKPPTLADLLNIPLPTKKHAAGGITLGAHLGMVGEAGPEAIIPLNNSGATFMAQMLNHYNKASMHRTPTMGSIYNQSYDYSMQFHGDIHVESQDPREMQRKLAQQRRLRALRAPRARTS